MEKDWDNLIILDACRYDTFIEVGTKSVVGAMVKKIDRSANVYTITKVEELDKMEELWKRK